MDDINNDNYECMNPAERAAFANGADYARRELLPQLAKMNEVVVLLTQAVDAAAAREPGDVERDLLAEIERLRIELDRYRYGNEPIPDRR